MSTVITVTSAADSGAGSLRAAIATATAGSTIRFASNLANRTITLTSGQLVINKSLTIDGTGASNLTISGNNASRVFFVQREKNFTLQNLIVANGRLNSPRLAFTSATEEERRNYAGAGIFTEGSANLTLINTQVNNNVAGFGAGVFAGFRSTTLIANSRFNGNDGTAAFNERGGGAIATASGGSLTVRGSRFTNNRGINGGAINSLLGPLTVEDSVFINNDSTPGGARTGGTSGYGGAIYTDGANSSGSSSGPGTIGGTITIRNSRFEGNRGAGQGGAMFLFAYPPDRVIVEGSTIIGNSVIRDADGAALGGGLRHGNAELTIRDTTFANNTALEQGGGLWVGETSPTTISNSTFTGNVADNGNGGGLGGAITLANRDTNATTITNTTIVNNRAGFQGGAFWFGNQPVTLANSIVANNTGGNPWGTLQQTRRSLQDGGGNIEFPAPAANDPRVTANSRIANPLLGPLQANGSGFLTHTILPGSPAIATGAGARSIWADSITGANAILGTRGRDTLLGNSNSNVLVGDGAADVLTGRAGGDRFHYSGVNQADTFLDSRLGAVDRITDFQVREGDRLQLNFDNNLITSERPTALFNAGRVTGRNLLTAARTAYADKNRRTTGKQPLRANEGVLFTWNRHTYLSVNNQSAGFSNRDLLIDVTGIAMPRRDVVAGVLPVAHYFI
ncbi:MAG: bluetail domain-containing putative surface protein [Oculatellaceae cyanobacterium bins.114]|nr:bluetail domain-containing putative surface protein [Oculatellaceae cyanobacterium bins.114]